MLGANAVVIRATSTASPLLVNAACNGQLGTMLARLHATATVKTSTADYIPHLLASQRANAMRCCLTL